MGGGPEVDGWGAGGGWSGRVGAGGGRVGVGGGWCGRVGAGGEWVGGRRWMGGGPEGVGVDGWGLEVNG